MITAVSISSAVSGRPGTGRREKRVWVAPALENDQPDSAEGQGKKEVKQQINGQVCKWNTGLGEKSKDLREDRFAERKERAHRITIFLGY